MRSTLNRSNLFRALFCNLRRELPFSQKNALGSCEQSGGQRSFCQFALNLRTLAEVVKSARKSLDVARQDQVAQYDKGHRDVPFNVEDLVLLR